MVCSLQFDHEYISRSGSHPSQRPIFLRIYKVGSDRQQDEWETYSPSAPCTGTIMVRCFPPVEGTTSSWTIMAFQKQDDWLPANQFQHAAQAAFKAWSRQHVAFAGNFDLRRGQVGEDDQVFTHEHSKRALSSNTPLAQNRYITHCEAWKTWDGFSAGLNGRTTGPTFTGLRRGTKPRYGTSPACAEPKNATKTVSQPWSKRCRNTAAISCSLKVTGSYRQRIGRLYKKRSTRNFVCLTIRCFYKPKEWSRHLIWDLHILVQQQEETSAGGATHERYTHLTREFDRRSRSRAWVRKLPCPKRKRRKRHKITSGTGRTASKSRNCSLSAATSNLR